MFFSLPGKRSKTMVYANLIITMVIGGLWHGAAWTFVIWGLLHGAGLAVVRWWQIYKKNAKTTGVWRYASIFATFHFVVLAWIFFRAPSLETAWAILGRIGSLTASAANLTAPLWIILAIGIAAQSVPKKWYDWSLGLFTRAPFYAQAAALALLVVGLQYVAQTGATPFIYNKF